MMGASESRAAAGPGVAIIKKEKMSASADIAMLVSDDDDDDDDEEDEEDDDVMEIDPSASNGAGDAGDAGDADEDGIQITGQVGTATARDMPHPRSLCAKNTFATASPFQKQMDTCNQCYCYVCDLKVSDCKKWATHCLADHTMPYWVGQRKAAKAAKLGGGAAAAGGGAPASVCPNAYSAHHTCYSACPGFVLTPDPTDALWAAAYEADPTALHVEPDLPAPAAVVLEPGPLEPADVQGKNLYAFLNSFRPISKQTPKKKRKKIRPKKRKTIIFKSAAPPFLNLRLVLTCAWFDVTSCVFKACRTSPLH